MWIKNNISKQTESYFQYFTFDQEYAYYSTIYSEYNKYLDYIGKIAFIIILYII
jgi:hypothetical protein